MYPGSIKSGVEGQKDRCSTVSMSLSKLFLPKQHSGERRKKKRNQLKHGLIYSIKVASVFRVSASSHLSPVLWRRLLDLLVAVNVDVGRVSVPGSCLCEFNAVTWLLKPIRER